jgi:hypothetical protein
LAFEMGVTCLTRTPASTMGLGNMFAKLNWLQNEDETQNVSFCGQAVTRHQDDQMSL